MSGRELVLSFEQRSLARGRRRRRRRAPRLARPRDVARSAARRRRAPSTSPQVRHGFDAALAASVPRPLLQLHAARAAARRERARVTTNRRWWSGMLATEDWWSVWIGLGIFALGLASLLGVDLVGWMARPRPWEWTDLTGAFAWSKLFAPAGAELRGLAPARVVRRDVRRVHGAVRARRALHAARRAPLRRRLHGAVRRDLGRVDCRQRAAPDDGRRDGRRPQSL